MLEKSRSGSSKTKTKNSETTHTWTITPANPDLFEGKISMNELLEREGYTTESSYERKMNDFLDANDQIALNLKKADKKEFLKNLDEKFIFKLHPKNKKFLSKTSEIFDKEVSIAKELVDDLYLKITRPSEFYSWETINKFKKRRGDV